MTIAVKSIAASINPDGQRIDTLLLKYPRCIHAELMTHRVFSRNAASSRAIPVERLIQSIIDDPFIPHYWGSNKPGMQAGDECNELVPLKRAETCLSGNDFTDGSFEKIDRNEAWQFAMYDAIDTARAFAKAGYHKQIVNRLLEPFAHITVLVTATEWDNFFDLRCHETAEPHIRELAQKISVARALTTPRSMSWGAWHLPFGPAQGSFFGVPHPVLVHSVACCASISYKTVDDFEMTEEKAISIYNKLLAKPLHASPFEHPARAFRGSCRNFQGWQQYRAIIESEIAYESNH